MPKQKRGKLINQETSQEYILIELNTPAYKSEDAFIMLYTGTNALKQIVESDLTFLQLKVFLYLADQMSFENWAQVPIDEIAQSLKSYKTNISAAIKVLVAKGYLEEGPKNGRFKSYRVSPQYMWKGKNKNRPKPNKFKLLKPTSSNVAEK